MSDAVRMIDLAPLSRGLDEFPRADPERQTLADRMAAKAAARHLETAHEDVGAPEGSSETRVDPPTEKGQRKRSRGRHQDPPQEEKPKADPIPEREEGRLLDIVA